MFDFYPESINQTPLPLQIDNIFVCNSLLYLFFRSTATLQRRWLNWDGNSPKHTIYCTHKMDWNVCVKEGTERKRLRNNRFHVNSLLPSKVTHTHKWKCSGSPPFLELTCTRFARALTRLLPTTSPSLSLTSSSFYLLLFASQRHNRNGNGTFSFRVVVFVRSCWQATQYHNKIHGSTVNKGFYSLATFILSPLFSCAPCHHLLSLCRLIFDSL